MYYSTNCHVLLDSWYGHAYNLTLLWRPVAMKYWYFLRPSHSPPSSSLAAFCDYIGQTTQPGTLTPIHSSHSLPIVVVFIYFLTYLAIYCHLPAWSRDWNSFVKLKQEMMTLPKLPTTANIKISEPNKLKKSGSDWLLLQESKSRYSSSSMSPNSSGATSIESSYPKLSTESGYSNYSEVTFLFLFIIQSIVA